MTSLAKEKVSRIDKDNMWLGPREEDLIHVGAKYSPCMREVGFSVLNYTGGGQILTLHEGGRILSTKLYRLGSNTHPA